MSDELIDLLLEAQGCEKSPCFACCEAQETAILANPDVVLRALGWEAFPAEQEADGQWAEPYCLRVAADPHTSDYTTKSF